MACSSVNDKETKETQSHEIETPTLMSRPKPNCFSRLAWIVVLCIAFPIVGFGHGDLHERIAVVTSEIKQQPANAELYLKRGELHGLHAEWKEAESDFDKAEKLDPKLVTVSLARSRVSLARNRFKEAQTDVERFLSAYPNHSIALIVRARALTGQKQFAESARAWATVIEKADHPDVEHFYERARVLVAAGPEQTDAAIKTLDEGLAQLGNVPTLGLYAVQLEVARKRYDAALERLDAMMPRTGRKETWLELRGDILASAGRKEEAEKTYIKALEELHALPARIRSTKASTDLEERLKKKAAKGKG
jgi:tetratricopeptide (TPR) repeat protein